MEYPLLYTLRSRRSHKSHGFSLLEIIATLLLLSIVAGIAVFASDSGTDQREAMTQVDLLRNHIRYAQSMAMKERVPWGLAYDGSSFWVFDRNGQRTLPGSTGAVESTITASPDPGGSVFFDFYGVPCSDNATTTPLASATTFTVTVGSASETLTLIPDTGYAQ